MFIFDTGNTKHLTADDWQKLLGKWMAWRTKILESGKFVSGARLQPGGKLINRSNNVIDGPYTEGKEVVGGFFIVQAENYDEAVAIANECPHLEVGGTVQVRQVLQM